MAKGSLNKVLLIGNVGKDVKCTITANGTNISQISIATSEVNADKVEKTEWHNVVFFGKLAEIVNQYVTKGSKIFIEGRIQLDKWTDKAGIERFTTKIIANNMQLLDSKKQQSSPSVAFNDNDIDIPF